MTSWTKPRQFPAGASERERESAYCFFIVSVFLLPTKVYTMNTASTPKAREVRQRISEAVGMIDKAFVKQVEALDEYRFIDLESEMDVLRDMLKSDGLIDEEQGEDDPFADVLSQRQQKKKAGTSGGQSLTMGGH